MGRREKKDAIRALMLKLKKSSRYENSNIARREGETSLGKKGRS